MIPSFTRSFIAEARHIDEMGHVNNAVWVQWIQDMATAHWDAAARPEDREQYVWLVVRHEIDYRGNIDLGQSVEGTTWIEGGARGAKSLRRVDFRDAAGDRQRGDHLGHARSHFGAPRAGAPRSDRAVRLT